MLDFRRSPGEVINEVYYNKKKIVLERGKKKMAVMIPVGLYEKLFTDDDVEIYSKERIREFEREDRLTGTTKVKIKNLL